MCIRDRDGDSLRTLNVQPSICMCPEKDAFGGIVGDLLPCQSPVPKGAVGHRREPVSGFDLASLLIQVENGGQGYPPVRFQLYQHGPAVVPLLGPIGRLGAKKDSLPIQFSGWLEKYLNISGCPGQPQGCLLYTSRCV